MISRSTGISMSGGQRTIAVPLTSRSMITAFAAPTLRLDHERKENAANDTRQLDRGDGRDRRIDDIANSPI